MSLVLRDELFDAQLVRALGPSAWLLLVAVFHQRLYDWLDSVLEHPAP